MLLGACGDNCTLCPRFKATQNNDIALLNSLLELYIKLGTRKPGATAESLKCYGCKASRQCAYPEVRNCAGSKKIENCGQCSSYPCEMINSVFSKTMAFKERLTGKISDSGMKMFEDAFLRKKEYLDSIKGNTSM